MPSRRAVLSVASLLPLGPLAGCSSPADDPKSVDVRLHNDDTEPRELRVAVGKDAGEAVFETTETVPADDGDTLGKKEIESAFEGRQTDRFTVRTWLGGDPAGSFEYRVTCPDENYVALLVEHHSHHRDGKPVHFNALRCAR